MKKIFKTLGIQLSLFLLLISSFGIIYAAWNDAVSPGAPLTAESWNEVVDRVKNIGTTDRDDIIAFGLAGGLNRPISFGWADNSIYHRIRSAGASNDGISIDLKDSAANLLLHSSEFRVSLSGENRFRILQNGNIGIGTNTPLNLLHIQSDSQVGARIVTTAEDMNAFLIFGSDIDGDAKYGHIGYDNRGEQNLKIVNDSDFNSSRNGIVINPQGFVGIKKINPIATLDVNGNINIGDEGVACTNINEGSIRYNGTSHQGCDGTTWNNLY